MPPPRRNDLASTSSPVLPAYPAPKIPEKEPPSGHERARSLAGQGAAIFFEQVTGHMEGEDCLESLALQGQATGICQKGGIPFALCERGAGPLVRRPGRRFSSRRACSPESCRRRSPVPGQPSPLSVGEILDATPPKAAASGVFFVPGFEVRFHEGLGGHETQ